MELNRGADPRENGGNFRCGITCNFTRRIVTAYEAQINARRNGKR